MPLCQMWKLCRARRTTEQGWGGVPTCSVTKTGMSRAAAARTRRQAVSTTAGKPLISGRKRSCTSHTNRAVLPSASRPSSCLAAMPAVAAVPAPACRLPTSPSQAPGVARALPAARAGTPAGEARLPGWTTGSRRKYEPFKCRQLGPTARLDGRSTN